MRDLCSVVCVILSDPILLKMGILEDSLFFCCSFGKILEVLFFREASVADNSLKFY